MSNLHKEIIDEDLHVAKGFADGTFGDLLWKNERGNQEFSKRGIFPPCLKLVASNAAPPTETDGAIYVIGNERGTLTVSVIAWQSSNTVRYTFSGSPNLSTYNVGDYIIVTGATNTVHNGVFVITSVNDGSDYVQVTNTLVSSSTYDEGVGASVKSTLSNWDGCNQNSWVKFNSVAGVWKEVVPHESTLCYNKDIDDFIYFNGTTWQQYTFTNTKKYGNTIFVNSVTGNDSTGMVENIDKPFATIAAAHTASAAYYTGGNAASATKIVTLNITGTFSENILLKNYHHYNLNDSHITGQIYDDSAVNCYVYGNAYITTIYNIVHLSYASTLTVKARQTVGSYRCDHASAVLVVDVYTCSSTSDSMVILNAGSMRFNNCTMNTTNYPLVTQGTSGTTRFENCQLTSNQEILITGTGSNSSTAVFRRCKLTTTGTNYDTINLLTNTGANCYMQIDSCTLIANGTGNSIDAAQATNVRIYGSCQTNLTHDTGNVTLLVGTVANGRFLIDTNVE